MAYMSLTNKPAGTPNEHDDLQIQYSKRPLDGAIAISAMLLESGCGAALLCPNRLKTPLSP